MATMYCALCRRPVEAHRRVGAGTVVLAVLTAGISLLAIPFYPKRCPICRSTAVTPANPYVLNDASDSQRRLSAQESELEALNAELDRLRTERDFYRQLLGDRAPEADRTRPTER